MADGWLGVSVGMETVLVAGEPAAHRAKMQG